MIVKTIKQNSIYFKKKDLTKPIRTTIYIFVPGGNSWLPAPGRTIVVLKKG